MTKDYIIASKSFLIFREELIENITKDITALDQSKQTLKNYFAHTLEVSLRDMKHFNDNYDKNILK